MIKLFDIQNGVLVPTEHCYALKALKDIMDIYPEEYMKVYQYLFYMSCPNPDVNPFFDVREHEKEELILTQLQAEFSTEDEDGTDMSEDTATQLFIVSLAMISLINRCIN